MPSDWAMERAERVSDALRTSRHNRGTVEDSWRILAAEFERIVEETLEAKALNGGCVEEYQDTWLTGWTAKGNAIRARFPAQAKEEG